MNRFFGFLLCLALALVVGCSGGNTPSYANVKGTVNYNGKPLEKGEITFAVSGKPPTTMDIVDGKYTGQAIVGANKVSITARKRAAGSPKLTKDAKVQIKGYKEWMRDKGGNSSPDFDPSVVDFIPPDYGSASKQQRVVEAGAPNEFDFNIKSSS
jgi:hypothetical protein